MHGVVCVLYIRMYHCTYMYGVVCVLYIRMYHCTYMYGVVCVLYIRMYHCTYMYGVVCVLYIRMYLCISYTCTCMCSGTSAYTYCALILCVQYVQAVALHTYICLSVCLRFSCVLLMHWSGPLLCGVMVCAAKYITTFNPCTHLTSLSLHHATPPHPPPLPSSPPPDRLPHVQLHWVYGQHASCDAATVLKGQTELGEYH